MNKCLPKIGVHEIYLFVVPKKVDHNFKLASKGLQKLKIVTPNEVNVRDLLKYDKVIFTAKSLREFSELLLGWLYMLEKPKAIRNKIIEDRLNLNYSQVQPDFEEPVYDPTQTWEPKFEILKDYYRKHKELRNSAKKEAEQKESKK